MPLFTQPPRSADIELAGPFPPDLHDVRHLWLKAGLLLLWALVSFGGTYFARDLQLAQERVGNAAVRADQDLRKGQVLLSVHVDADGVPGVQPVLFLRAQRCHRQ